MKHNIILIGMPCAGKSTIGVIAAKFLGKSFLDTDLLIQEQTGAMLADLIADRGNDGFIALENEILSAVDVENTIIATGGSAVYSEPAMEHLKKNGTVVYLKINYNDLQSRLGDLEARGVVLKDGQSLADLYKERCKLYEKYSDITITEDSLTIDETVVALVNALTAK